MDVVRELLTAAREVAGIEIEAAKARTLRQVNQYLWKNGMPKNLELVKGRGYFYFRGGNTPRWPQTGVYVYKLADLSLKDWLREYKNLAKDAPDDDDEDINDDVIVIRRRRKSRFVSAAEMEEYCPSCAAAIRAGEMQVTWDELLEVISETD